jgi:membrane fusion protein (multidrug efflux system)
MPPDSRNLKTPADAQPIASASIDAEVLERPSGKLAHPFAEKESFPASTMPVRKSSSRRWLRVALFALLPLALLGGVYVYATGGRVVSTDDSYVNARQVSISTDVSGIVADVNVTDNERVSEGQVLYRLESRQFQIAVDRAKSNLAQTELTLESMKADYKQLIADAQAQEARVELDEANNRRDEALLGSGAIAKMEADRAEYTLKSDANTLTALRQQVASQLVRLGGDADKPVRELPQYREAQAELNEAQRQLDDTVVRAPFDGTVTNVPSIAPGKYLAASTVAFYLVDADHLWIDATPKETELAHVRPGQKATITVDTYPGIVWYGVVQSISPAAAQQFSLLPAQNTSGNWVKVVQRVPVRVNVDTSDKNMPPLWAGMSVVVGIDTGHVRGLPSFFGFARPAQEFRYARAAGE